jgi:hypothetical protein
MREIVSRVLAARFALGYPDAGANERIHPHQDRHVIRRILTSLVVLAGCLAIGYVALYPPRRERLQGVFSNHGPEVKRFRYHETALWNPDREIPRVSLFHDNPHYFYRVNDGPLLTEIDVGRLVVEALLILAFTGAVVAALNLFSGGHTNAAEPSAPAPRPRA